INLHPSLLPRYRGPSPLSAAILNGDAETGITVQRLAIKMDSGDILAQYRFPLTGMETTGSLLGFTSEKGAELLVAVLDSIEAGTEKATSQDESMATYCSLVKKEDGVIDWSKSTVYLSKMIRAYDPWPKTWTTYKNKNLFILQAEPFKGENDFLQKKAGTVLSVDKDQGILVQTGDGILAVRKLQFQARKPLEGKIFINGVRDFIGSTLGD
ncbi:MAG: methionyl-tRNA formyltransferase, partial [Spirochaetota bacterium]